MGIIYRKNKSKARREEAAAVAASKKNKSNPRPALSPKAIHNPDEPKGSDRMRNPVLLAQLEQYQHAMIQRQQQQAIPLRNVMGVGMNGYYGGALCMPGTGRGM